jgi:CheY-like chemotaxis protein
MTIWMLVEDEPDFYELVLNIYEMLGIDGLAFTNGEDALAWIEDADQEEVMDNLPQLALLDIRLPGKATGVEVAARLRQSPLLGNIVIVMMTAYRLSPAQERAVIAQSGCDRLIYKPLTFQPAILPCRANVSIRDGFTCDKQADNSYRLIDQVTATSCPAFLSLSTLTVSNGTLGAMHCARSGNVRQILYRAHIFSAPADKT